MEFKEFSNPEAADYDILSSQNGVHSKERGASEEDLSFELMNLIGILEDVSESDLMEQYGITLEEYYHPTPAVVLKVRHSLENNKENEKTR